MLGSLPIHVDAANENITLGGRWNWRQRIWVWMCGARPAVYPRGEPWTQGYGLTQTQKSILGGLWMSMWKVKQWSAQTTPEYLHGPGIGNDSLSKNKTASTSKEKNDKLRSLNRKRFVPRHHSKNEKWSHRVGESICNAFNGQRALYADYRKN